MGTNMAYLREETSGWNAESQNVCREEECEKATRPDQKTSVLSAMLELDDIHEEWCSAQRCWCDATYQWDGIFEMDVMKEGRSLKDVRRF